MGTGCRKDYDVCPSHFKFLGMFSYARLMTKFNVPRPARLVLAKLNAAWLVKRAASVETRQPVRRGNVG